MSCNNVARSTAVNDSRKRAIRCGVMLTVDKKRSLVQQSKKAFKPLGQGNVLSNRKRVGNTP